MVGVCFFHGGFHEEHKSHFDISTWTTLCRALGATNLSIVMKGKEQLPKEFKKEKSVEVRQIGSPKRFRKSAKFDDVTIVQLVGKKSGADIEAVDLKDFEHPENAMYVVGHDKDGSPDHFVTDGPHAFVRIPTEFDIWAQQAAAVVLWDRISKA